MYEDCSFTYNAYGQRVQKRYAYDPNPASNSDYSYSYETTYQYDHFGRLIREVCTERYIGGHVNNREFIYLYDHTGVVGVMYKLNNSSFVRYYYQRNLQGDVVALYDENGTRKVEYAYDAWGNCTITYGAGTDLAKSNPIRYRGYYYDRETGLYYLNARYYNPQWRRFISPVTNMITPNAVNGLNAYAYANNNPINIAYRSSNTNGCSNRTMSSIGIAGPAYRKRMHSNFYTTYRNIPAVPEWVDTVSTAVDHAFSVVNPIRTAVATLRYTNLWEVMRLDGVTELPGTLSQVATGVGWGLGIIGGVITGYEKYASGASVSSSIAGGIINAGINIGGMYAASAIASWGMGLLIAGTSLSGGAIVLIGVAGGVLVGVAIHHTLTKLNICGNTIEGHLNNLVDWLIFWD